VLYLQNLLLNAEEAVKKERKKELRRSLSAVLSHSAALWQIN
jgi:hypothetical protein